MGVTADKNVWVRLITFAHVPELHQYVMLLWWQLWGLLSWCHIFRSIHLHTLQDGAPVSFMGTWSLLWVPDL